MSAAPVQVNLSADVERFTAGIRLAWDAIVEAARPVILAFQQIGQTFARYQVSTPEAKALRELDNALDWSEHHLEVVLATTRHDLLAGASAFAMREQMWAGLTWGLTEQDVMARCRYVMRSRFVLNLTATEAAQVAVAILTAYASRPAAWTVHPNKTGA